jgi:hypothetical protein
MGMQKYVSRLIGIISLKEWRLHFKAWMLAKRQWNPIFNPWWAFELLLQHFFSNFRIGI